VRTRSRRAATSGAYYRCGFGKEYAATKVLEHPATVYLREADVVAALDLWLAKSFADEGSVDDIIAALNDAQHAPTRGDAKVKVLAPKSPTVIVASVSTARRSTRAATR
jgi:hypothetical protein